MAKEELDRTVAPVIGGPVADYDLTQPGVFTHDCEQCGAPLAYSQRIFDTAGPLAVLAGKQLVHLCQSCANPYMQRLAREGGFLAGGRERVGEKVQELKKIRQQQAESN